MSERGERGYRWPGDRAEPGVPADGALDPGVPDPDDADLLDWRDVAAIGDEQARLYALWRRGRIGNRAAKTGMALLARLAETGERAAGSRLGELETLVEQLEAKVAVAARPRH